MPQNKVSIHVDESDQDQHTTPGMKILTIRCLWMVVAMKSGIGTCFVYALHHLK